MTRGKVRRTPRKGDGVPKTRRRTNKAARPTSASTTTTPQGRRRPATIDDGQATAGDDTDTHRKAHDGQLPAPKKKTGKQKAALASTALDARVRAQDESRRCMETYKMVFRALDANATKVTNAAE